MRKDLSDMPLKTKTVEELNLPAFSETCDAALGKVNKNSELKILRTRRTEERGCWGSTTGF